MLGVSCPRSCCRFCCFQAPRSGRDALAARWRAEPEAGAYALHVERRALSIISEVAGLARAELAGASVWTVVETRRVYRPASVKDPATGKSRPGRDGRTVKDPARKGDTWRSIHPHTVTSTRDDGLAELHRLARAHDTVVWAGPDGVSRVDVRVLPDRPREWPLTTHEYALMPGTICVKQHAGFDHEWDAARAREAVLGGGVTPLPLAM